MRMTDCTDDWGLWDINHSAFINQSNAVPSVLLHQELMYADIVTHCNTTSAIHFLTLIVEGHILIYYTKDLKWLKGRYEGEI